MTDEQRAILDDVMPWPRLTLRERGEVIAVVARMLAAERERGRAEVAERVEAVLDYWAGEAERFGLVQHDAVAASVRAALRGGAA